MRISPQYQVYSKWINPVLSGLGIGLFPYIKPDHPIEIFHILSILGILSVAMSAGRLSSYLNAAAILLASIWFYGQSLREFQGLLTFFAPFLLCFALVEAVARIQDTAQQHIHRLETINKVSRQIMMSLDTEQTLSLLNATIQNALDADTYYIGLVKDGEVHLDLFYDDGEYFNGTRIPVEGTLTGWVIRNQKELLLHDLLELAAPDGTRHFPIGKDRVSRSWMGVPLKAANVTGVIALASYAPNAFDTADMELLTNLAQHVTLALDNTIRHARVEEQARLDSLTGVYNHAYFLQRLSEQAEAALQSRIPLSLIMLDIDFFKQYNDTHGHLVGDKILHALCTAIKNNIKQSDSVGRWGGEEFVIALVGANGDQAIHVAERIGETLSKLRVEDRDQKTVAVPTVSQGIAVFPLEETDIYRLIDLADKRLYIAKARGRNQVEPAAGFWQAEITETARSGS
jgi:diguanylate cyclase (GGDEF)-like protein